MTALQRQILFFARSWLCVGFGLSSFTYSIAAAPAPANALAPRAIPTKPAINSLRASPVISPLKPGDTGPAVASLQDALLVLLERKLIQAFDAPDRPTQDELQILTASLNQERAQALFGKATQQLVRYFQVQQGLGDTLGGAIDDTTAAKFNELLQAIAAPDIPPTPSGPAGPVNPAPVPPYSLSLKAGDNGPSVTTLQDALLIMLQRKIIQSFDAPNRPTPDEMRTLTDSLNQERVAGSFGGATQQLVGYFQVQQGLDDNVHGVVDEKTAAKINELLIALGVSLPTQTGAVSTLRKQTTTAEAPPAFTNSTASPLAAVTDSADQGARDPAEFFRVAGLVRKTFASSRYPTSSEETASYSSKMTVKDLLATYEHSLQAAGWEQTIRQQNASPAAVAEQFRVRWSKGRQTVEISLSLTRAGRSEVSVQVSTTRIGLLSPDVNHDGTVASALPPGAGSLDDQGKRDPQDFPRIAGSVRRSYASWGPVDSSQESAVYRVKNAMAEVESFYVTQLAQGPWEESLRSEYGDPPSGTHGVSLRWRKIRRMAEVTLTEIEPGATEINVRLTTLAQ